MTTKFGGVISARHLLAVLGSLGMAIVYGLKVNLSVAIVSMVNHTAISLASGNGLGKSVSLGPNDNDCGHLGPNVTKSLEDGPFIWPGSLQGTMLSSYFWGYIVAQVPGGRIAEVFSAKWVMFSAVAINVVCTMLTPFTAKIHYVAMLLMRIAEGIGGGVTFPAMHVMLAHWSPPDERSVMSSMVYAGTALGTVISMLTAGIIAGSIGWEAVFYIMGGASVFWLILWTVLVADTPDQSYFISNEERDFITRSVGIDGTNKKSAKIPWKQIATSTPFLAILVAHTCNNWGWYMVLIELPLYMSTVLKFKITENAVLMAVPFFTMWIFSLILSKTVDVLRVQKKLSTTHARKMATLIASVIPMICFILLCYIGCNRKFAVVLMTLAITALGGTFCGFLSNHIDIAPKYAGTLVGVTNTFASIPGILVPIFVGNLVQNDPSINSWCKIFWTTVAFYVIEIFVYSYFASGEEQEWHKDTFTTNAETQLLTSPSAQAQEVGYDSTKGDEQSQ